jgi:hypothetical protein
MKAPPNLKIFNNNCGDETKDKRCSHEAAMMLVKLRTLLRKAQQADRLSTWNIRFPS